MTQLTKVKQERWPPWSNNEQRHGSTSDSGPVTGEAEFGAAAAQSYAASSIPIQCWTLSGPAMKDRQTESRRAALQTRGSAELQNTSSKNYSHRSAPEKKRFQMRHIFSLQQSHSAAEGGPTKIAHFMWHHIFTEKKVSESRTGDTFFRYRVIFCSTGWADKNCTFYVLSFLQTRNVCESSTGDTFYVTTAITFGSRSGPKKPNIYETPYFCSHYTYIMSPFPAKNLSTLFVNK